ncbi:Hypothetical protein SCF082_LOCUS8438 [Durusdinium trenchii]|uniref:Uncharacterized protein n=1 Tax=Durusdinium trenchii TaxID=1381693 RepID=A0ABP0IR42_9DINO
MAAWRSMGVELPAFDVISHDLPPPPFYPQACERRARSATPGSRPSTDRATGSRASLRSAPTSMPRALQHAVQHAQALQRSNSASTGRSSRASLLSAARRSARRAAFEALAKLSLGDHVAQLMQQPLPMKGYKPQEEDYKKTLSNGSALPVCPVHLMMPQTTVQSLTRYGSPEIAACRNQKAAVQWHGYQKNGNSAYNEQVVQQAHLMRK